MRTFRRERAIILILALASLVLFIISSLQDQRTQLLADGNRSVFVPSVALVIFLLLILLWFLLIKGAGDRSNREPQPSADDKTAPIFISGDVTLLTRHPTSLAGENLIAQLQEHPVIQSEPDLRAALGREARVTDLGQQQGEILSLVITEITSIKQTPSTSGQDTTLALIERLNGKIAQYRSASTTGITLAASSPNWLSNGAHRIGGAGGPGGMPVRPQGTTQNAQTLLEEAWRLVLPAGMTPTNGGEGVHVAIIDTMPCHTDLKRAYKRWGGTNGLMATLLAPGGPLTLYPAGNAHLLQSVDYHLNQHEYPMPDHGLFVAGIIHSIAPKAQIHLIEGLNTYGVGTFETFANAIALARRIAQKASLADVDIENMGAVAAMTTTPDAGQATQVRPERANASASTITPNYLPMVMNCSFVFTAPPAGSSDPLARASSYLTTIWDTLNLRDDMLIVGAAGNDARGQVVASRPQERYPAAFASVVGVAALDQQGNPTLYTDTANLPGKDNFAVFGGVAQLGATAADPNMTDAQYGMLGIYSGTKYPDGTPNPDGWARWAGTSFAAPVISGALALALSPAAATGLGNPIDLSKLHTAALERVRGAVAGATNTSAPDVTPPGDVAPRIIVSQ